ncbi:hypothetical protein EON65_17760 [archaeon]|nr:MAG: hypothetical protein EON65_17760 [archaeon]
MYERYGSQTYMCMHTHTYTNTYTYRDFNRKHGRPVMKNEDILPVANEYQRYKVRYMVCSIWCKVYCVWCMVHGTMHRVRSV